MAATGFFSKSVERDADDVIYKFDINYDLIPGEYEILVNNLPKGYSQVGEDGYNYETEDAYGHGISILPIYNTADLDELDGELEQSGVEKVEEMTLSGMEANIITLKEADKYKKGKYFFLFNSMEGYVIEVWGDNVVPMEDVIAFADNLTVTRVGDAAFETADEKAERESEREKNVSINQDAEKIMEQVIEADIPMDKLFVLGEEVKTMDGEMGYTVTDFEYFDSISDYNEADFFDYSRLEKWVNEDGTLKPYTRQRYDEKEQLLSESLTETKV